MDTKPYLVPCQNCGSRGRRRFNKPFTCRMCKRGKFFVHDWDLIREKILKRDKYKCQLCKQKNKLQVHHKDKNRLNNNEKNLITYCRQCHFSQHGKNFKKPLKVKVGLYGTRLIYKLEKIKLKHKKQPIRFMGL